MAAPPLPLACEVRYTTLEIRPPVVRIFRLPRAAEPHVPLLTSDPSGTSDIRTEGMNVADPGFNRPMLVIDPDFLDQVEVRHGALPVDAGPYAGRRVDYSRLSGVNSWKTQMSLRYTPRLHRPRLALMPTALQSHIDPKYGLHASASVSGPVIKDRLFWAAGLSFTRRQATLRQTFHAPNGKRFAEQGFPVATMAGQAFVGVDAYMGPRHRISATGIVNPGFARRAFRRADPYDADADFPGLRPTEDPRTRRPLVADGLVNGSLGWDRSDAFAVISSYEGRSYDDTWEFDARAGYAQRTSIEAWRLDDESLRERPAVTWHEPEGRQLLDALSADEGLHLAPGADVSCAGQGSAADPVCPVRRWASGGIGHTQRSRSLRGGGAAAVTKYFGRGWLAHAAKVGVELEHTARRRVLQASGVGDFRRFEGPAAKASTRRIAAQNYAVSVEDRVRLSPHLAVVPGVRWDAQDVRDIEGRRVAVVAGNVAPRASFVYDWTKAGRSRTHASFGWLSQQLPLAMFDTVTAVDRKLRGQYNQEITAGYEHEVVEDLVLSVLWMHRGLRRAVVPIAPDADERFVLANPEGQFPKPRRTTDAVTLRASKRYSNSWTVTGAYTYAREVGNYDGFADPLTGFIDRSVRLAFATPELAKNRFGPRPDSAPHRGQLDLTYLWDFDSNGYLATSLGVRASSGRPISVRAASEAFPGAFPVQLLARGAGGRMDPLAQLNLRVEYTYTIGDLALTAGFGLTNVTNAKATIVVDDRYTLDAARPIVGGDRSDLAHARVADRSGDRRFTRTLVRRNPAWRHDLAYQLPVAGDLELRVRF